MKNKKIIIFSMASASLLLLASLFFISKSNPTKNNDFFRNMQSSLQCAKESETTGASGMPSSCCSGLKAVGGWPGGYNGDCTLPPPPTGLSRCVKCGDGKCDTYNGENKCNCKEDCTGAETPCINYFQNISDESKQSCCGKLKAIKIALYQNDCSITPNSAPTSIKCMNCGDGRCDQGVYLENKCNCPEDCK